MCQKRKRDSSTKVGFFGFFNRFPSSQIVTLHSLVRNCVLSVHTLCFIVAENYVKFMAKLAVNLAQNSSGTNIGLRKP